MSIRKIAALAALGGLAAAAAHAQVGFDAVPADLPIIGAPHPGGIDFQPPGTEILRQVRWLDGMINVIIAGIVVFVTGLLAWVVIRYNRRRHPNPATFTHNTPVEVAWTIVPILILVFIGAFSLPVLFFEQEIPEADITIKVTGYQWYWGYEYVDEGIEFEQFMLTPAQLPEYGYDESLYRLATDTAVVVPVGPRW